MKNKLSFIISFFAIALMFNACDDDPAPKADFIFTLDGLTVVFENFSTDATSYVWDFGDGNTSTTENPTHVYAAEGTYTVSLTATGSGGDDTYSEAITVSKPSITVDGNFDEWADYDTYYTGPSGSLLEAKVTAKNGFLFFYFRADAAAAGPVIQVYIDKDNDGATGWDYWGAYETPGVEYLIEYVLEAFDGQYGPAEPGSVLLSADQEDWPWNTILAEDLINESSGWVTSGNEKILEFSVAQSFMPDLGGTVRMCFTNADNDWEEAGTLPAAWGDPANPLQSIEL